jgi:hypothetical protein
MSDVDCDVLGKKINQCSRGLFGKSGGNDLYPDNVCVGSTCNPGDGSTIEGCDGDTGICLATASGGICLGACNFDDSTRVPSGCVGKDLCNVYGWGKTSDMTVVGVGFCFGGCFQDADCGTGQECQREDGLCVKTGSKVAYSKALGTACTKADSTSSPAKCNCNYAPSTGNGYCSQVCRMGMSGDCPSGFLCDAQLPKTPILDGDTVFTSAPAGIAGFCLKTCSSDADCAPLGAYCEENAGVGGKTCQVGAKRCKDDTTCPTGQKCMGASATQPGSCK